MTRPQINFFSQLEHFRLGEENWSGHDCEYYPTRRKHGLGTIADIIRLGENMVWARLLILSDWEKTWSGHDC